MTNAYPTKLNKELLDNLLQAVNEIERYIEERPSIFGTYEVITQLVPPHLFKDNQANYIGCHWVIIPDEYLPDKDKVYVMKYEDMWPYRVKWE